MDRLHPRADTGAPPRSLAMSTPAPAALPLADPTWGRSLACAITSFVLGLTQSLGLNLVTANLPYIQGSLGATAAEANWLTTAYFSTALSASLLTTKFRMHYGLERFTACGLVAVVIVNALHLLTDSLATGIFARAALGFAGAPLTTLTVLYMVEAMPKQRAPFGLLMGFCWLQLGQPLARVISPDLLEIGRWHGLYLIELALSILCLAAIAIVPLKPMPTFTAFSKGDLFAFPLYAASLALLCVVLTQGRLHWWRDTPWLGECLAWSVLLFGVYLVIELARAHPMLNFSWLLQGYNLRFMLAVVLFRIALAEQTSGIVGLMTALGQSNEQMRTLFAWVTLTTLAGFALAMFILPRAGPRALGILAALVIILGAGLDTSSTSLTRPQELYVSQGLLGMGLALFIGAAALLGFGQVLAQGGRDIITFTAAFSASQYIGTLLGMAWITTFVADRITWHFSALVQHIAIGDPSVAARLQQSAAAFARFIADPGGRGLQGTATLAGQVVREASVLAYNDVFLSIALLGCALFVWMSYMAVRNAARMRRDAAAAAAAAAGRT
jgi:MFS family permease